jgi:N-methylhydantoinase B
MLEDGVTFTHRRDRHDFQPWGLQGGRPAPTYRTVVRRTDGTTESLPSQAVVSLDAGDVVDVYTTGGGGYGPPSERSVEAVRRDLREETVSPEAAESDYCVVLDDGDVDEEATRRRREQAEAADDDLVDRGDFPAPVV